LYGELVIAARVGRYASTLSVPRLNRLLKLRLMMANRRDVVKIDRQQLRIVLINDGTFQRRSD
jgi:hypothetical protein